MSLFCRVQYSLDLAPWIIRGKKPPRIKSSSRKRTGQELSWPKLSVPDLPRPGPAISSPCGQGSEQSRPIFPPGIPERENIGSKDIKKKKKYVNEKSKRNIAKAKKSFNLLINLKVACLAY